jgi:hypothetical protein
MPTAVLSRAITSPALMCPVFSLPGGGTSATYFSPNSVLGRIRALTAREISLTWSGLSDRFTVASSPSVETERTSPTMMPRSFTSACVFSCRPM